MKRHLIDTRTYEDIDAQSHEIPGAIEIPALEDEAESLKPGDELRAEREARQAAANRADILESENKTLREQLTRAKAEIQGLHITDQIRVSHAADLIRAILKQEGR